MWLRLQPFTNLSAARRSEEPDRIVERSFVFVDLAGSTAWSTGVEPVRACALVRTRLARMCASVRADRGEVVKLLGDGLHSAFLRPADAVRCAIAIQRGMLGDPARPAVGFPKARIGLATGTCVRYVLLDRVDYYGRPVFVAARLAQHGPGGVINLSGDVLDAAGVAEALEGYRLVSQDVTVRGYDQPIRVHQLHDVQLGSDFEDDADAAPGETALDAAAGAR